MAAPSLYRLDLTQDCDDSIKLLRGLRQHLVFADLTSVLMQIGNRQQAYLLVQGCPGCAEDRCVAGCRAALLNRVVMGAFGATSRLSHIPKGLAPRPYARVYTLTPASTATMFEASTLAPWPEARLALHWCRVPKGAPLVAGVLAVGEQGPDPVAALAERGWQVRSVRAPFNRWGWLRPQLLRAVAPPLLRPLVLPAPKPWHRDPAILTVPIGERQTAVDTPPEPPADPVEERALAGAEELLNRLIPEGTPLRPLAPVRGQHDLLPADGRAIESASRQGECVATAAVGSEADPVDEDDRGEGYAPPLVFTIDGDNSQVEGAATTAAAEIGDAALLAPVAADHRRFWDAHALTEIGPDTPYDELCEIVARQLAIILAGIALYTARIGPASQDAEDPAEAAETAPQHSAGAPHTTGANTRRDRADGPSADEREEAGEVPVLGEGRGAMYRRDVEELIAAMLASDAIMRGVRDDRAEGPGIKRKRVAAVLKPQHQHHAQRVVRWMENATLIHAAEDPTQPDKYARPLHVTDLREMLDSLLSQQP
jgi:hypothetical protein